MTPPAITHVLLRDRGKGLKHDLNFIFGRVKSSETLDLVKTGGVVGNLNDQLERGWGFRRCSRQPTANGSLQSSGLHERHQGCYFSLCLNADSCIHIPHFLLRNKLVTRCRPPRRKNLIAHCET